VIQIVGDADVNVGVEDPPTGSNQAAEDTCLESGITHKSGKLIPATFAARLPNRPHKVNKISIVVLKDTLWGSPCFAVEQAVP